MAEAAGKHEGIGSSILRLEDDRYLRGRGRFIADIRLPGILDVAFVRSPVAHARIRGIAKPEGHETSVFVMADLKGVKGIRADSGLPGFRRSVQPVLAYEKVRHVGEPLAACIADTRAEAEDIEIGRAHV
jgi:aerobic carbon-monoxide dehydrogenase large subunit